MGWGDLLAAASGAASGYAGSVEQHKKDELAQDKFDMAQSVAQVRAMIDGLKIESANNRADQAEAGRNTRAGQSDATRRYGIDTGAATAKYGTDTRDSEYWDNADRQWSLGDMRDATTRRGQDVSAATARRGQDLTADTAGKNRDNESEARAETYALNAYKADVAAKKSAAAGSLFADPNAAPAAEPSFQDWLKTTADPEVFPSVLRAHGVGQPAAAGPQPTPPAAAPAPPAQPSAPPPVNRPAPPVPARAPAAAAAPPLEQQAKTLIDQIRAADSGGQDSTGLRKQLAALRAQVK